MPDKVKLAVQTQIKNIETSTGKPFAEWVAIARKHGGKHGEMLKMLKEKYGISHGNANLIALEARKVQEPVKPEGADPADTWFEGKKANLRPLYDAIYGTVQKLGPDVDFSPKKTYMSLRRNKQFGCIMPATATRIDVGLNLKGTKPTKRLLAEKPGGMFTHRVAVTDAGEIDKELVAWLKQAYEQP